MVKIHHLDTKECQLEKESIMNPTMMVFTDFRTNLHKTLA